MDTKEQIDLEEFTRQYIVTALWSSLDDNDQPLDDQYDQSDLAPATLSRMRADCQKFHAANKQHYQDASTAGHDFWLTRNRHGAGFWDGDYAEPESTLLTQAAHAFGECDLYVGDDGQLYL